MGRKRELKTPLCFSKFLFHLDLITDLEASLCRLIGLVARLLKLNPFSISWATPTALGLESP